MSESRDNGLYNPLLSISAQLASELWESSEGKKDSEGEDRHRYLHGRKRRSSERRRVREVLRSVVYQPEETKEKEKKGADDITEEKVDTVYALNLCFSFKPNPGKGRNGEHRFLLSSKERAN